MASVARYCCCGAPCSDCATGVGNPGTDPESAVVAGITGAHCATSNGTATYSGYTADILPLSPDQVCVWNWSTGVTGVTLYYSPTGGTIRAGSGCELALSAGEWAIGVDTRTGTEEWVEKTTGFVCSGGKISGSHAYTVGPCIDDFGCDGAVTVTVDP